MLDRLNTSSPLARLPIIRDAELAILNAPFETGGWERAVAEIAEATGSSAAHLLGLGGPMLMPLNTIAGNFAGYESYFGDPALHGRSNWRIGVTTAVGEIRHESDYASYRLSHDTSDYDDAVADLDIPYGCQSALLLDGQCLLGLALLRSQRDGPCREDTLRRFAALSAQLARAVRVELALGGEAAELMLGNCRSLDGATLILDRFGSLLALTPAAEELFGESGPLTLSGLRVSLRRTADNDLLQAALGRLLVGDGIREPVLHVARIGRNSTNPMAQWWVYAVRLPRMRHCLGFEPHLALTLKPVNACRREAG